MSKRSGKRARPAAAVAGDERRIESLTVAMAMAPGVYARNRMFALFKSPAVQRAKSRAATLRGIAKHLARASAVTLSRDSEGTGLGAATPGDYVLKYQIPVLRLARVAELSRVELATLRLMAAGAGASCLPPDEEDKALVDGALARLLTDEAPLLPVVRAAE
ncbi:MAG: hypothetical protein JWP97_4003 [Labilithrix sp.]|nr:hypothetical protein [Labilithrix sp.]